MNIHISKQKRLFTQLKRLIPIPFQQLNMIASSIATHNGTFQADEAIGVWLLRQLPRYSSAQIIRSRDPAIFSKADIVSMDEFTLLREHEPNLKQYIFTF